MPELPEVETTRRGIAPHASGQVIKRVIVRNRNMRFPIPKSLQSSATGQKIVAVSRRGKYLLLAVSCGHIIIHLGMSGVLQVADAKTKLKKHDHVDIVLANGKILRLNDPRRFGCVLWHGVDMGDINQHRLLVHLAPEPLSDAFNAEYLSAQLHGKKVAIKTAIMNNRIVVGVGNIYTSESLFASGIHPLIRAGDIKFAHIKKLVTHIKLILQQSIDTGGTTLKDFTAPDGKPGYFVQDLSVYGRAGLPCLRCDAPIQQITIANRASYFCPKCQAVAKPAK